MLDSLASQLAVKVSVRLGPTVAVKLDKSEGEPEREREREKGGQRIASCDAVLLMIGL